MHWSAPRTVQCHPCRGTGWEVDSLRGGSASAPFGAGVCSWCPASHFSAHVCWSWHNACGLFFHSSSSFPLIPHVTAVPGTWCCFHPYPLPFPSEKRSLSGLSDNPPASSFPDQVPSLSCSHPCAPTSLPLTVLGWCHISSVSPRAAITFSPADPLLPSPDTGSPALLSLQHSFMQLHGCLLHLPTPARLLFPLPPSS